MQAVRVVLVACLVLALANGPGWADPFTSPVSPCAPVTVLNAGFEDPALADGTNDDEIPDWEETTQTAVVNPNTTVFTGEAPEEENVAVVGRGNSIWQDVGALEEGSRYCLSVLVGDPANSVPTTYRVSLRDATADTELAAATQADVALVNDAFVLVRIETGAISAAQDGNTLRILFEHTSAAASRLAFDDVKLECCPWGNPALSIDRCVWASSIQGSANSFRFDKFGPHLAVDGNKATTRWSSVNTSYSKQVLPAGGVPSNVTYGQWWKVDLGDVFWIDSLRICFEAAASNRYEVCYSLDGCSWTTFIDFTRGSASPVPGPVDDFPISAFVGAAPVCARFLLWKGGFDPAFPNRYQNVSFYEFAPVGTQKCGPEPAHSAPVNLLDGNVFSVDVNDDNGPDLAPANANPAKIFGNVPAEVADNLPPKVALESTTFNPLDAYGVEHKSFAHGASDPDGGELTIHLTAPISVNEIKILFGMRNPPIKYRLRVYDGAWQDFADVVDAADPASLENGDGAWDIVQGYTIFTGVTRIRIVSKKAYNTGISTGITVHELQAFNCP